MREREGRVDVGAESTWVDDAWVVGNGGSVGIRQGNSSPDVHGVADESGVKLERGRAGKSAGESFG